MDVAISTYDLHAEGSLMENTSWNVLSSSQGKCGQVGWPNTR